MTKTNFTTKHSQVKPTGFYVYAHRKSTDGQIFYIGKGSGERAWCKRRDYNPYWMNTSRKYGVVVDILQDNMDEDSAYLLEEWLIAKFRKDGLSLTNLDDGGIGGSRLGIEVFCSNGMSFDSIGLAVDWLKNNGHPLACMGGITKCCRGDIMSSYGYVWSYTSEFSHDFATRGERLSTAKKIPLACSNGMTFDSATDAAMWLRCNGWPKASNGIISNCRRGLNKTAYGYTWFDVDDVPKEYVKPKNKAKAVRCSNGMVFNKGLDAVKWLRENGYPKAGASGISHCCNGKSKVAYGYRWEFVAPTQNPPS